MKTKYMPTESTAAERQSARIALSRRNFLRGVGACLALPALESLSPLKALASSAPKMAVTSTGAPIRTAFVFFPNGAIPAAWWPQAEGVGYPISQTLKPLESCRKMIQVMGGLDQRNAIGGVDGGGDHARGTGVFLTGVHLNKSATDIHSGVSIDQVMGREVGHMTRFPSLELTCDSVRKSGDCDNGYSCAYQYNLSWNSPTTPMTPETNPRLVFERLFGLGAPQERAQNLKRRQADQRSILDFVMEDARRMERRMDGHDKDKLDQYLTGVREVETRIQRAERLHPVKDPGCATPAGIPADYAEYIQLMFELLALSFQTDSTRVATLCLAHDGDNRSFGEIGIPEGHHDLSHHEGRPERIQKVAEIDRWYVTQFARFLQKLDSIKDADGKSVLHNSMIVYGGGNADGNAHTHVNLPIVLAGAGGGTLTTGRHINYHSTPMCNLYMSMADRMGLRSLPRFGDSTGRLTDV